MEKALTAIFTICVLLGVALVDGSIYSPRIMGGEVVDILRVSHHAALFVGDELVCGAVIISPSYVLTDAYCGRFVLISNEPSTIVCGSNRTNDDKIGQTVGVKKVLIHPRHYLYTYDIAILELEEELNRTATTRPVPIADCCEDGPRGNLGTVVGWGILNPLSDKASLTLQGMTVSVMKWDVCNKIFEKLGVQLKKSLFCAIGTGVFCEGDYGGGIVVNGRLSGIITIPGTTCGTPGLPAFYTNLLHPSIRWFIWSVTGF